MRRIHFDPDGRHWNSLNNKHKHYSIHTHILTHTVYSSIINPTYAHSALIQLIEHTIQTHLVSKQNHDGVAACSRRSVFDSECVVVVPNDVKVDVGLCRSHHSRGALDSNADVT